MKDKRLSTRAHRSKHACVALLSALLAVTSHSAAAASAAVPDKAYPVKPVRVVVPYAPGGGTDVLARLVAAKLTEAWGQSVIVDNRPGGATVIGAEAVARAPADGYMLLISTPTHVVNATLQPKLPFDPVRDFKPITLLSTSPNIFVVHPSLPVRTTKQFLALAKAKPGQITYGSSGIGGTGHLSMEMIKQMSGINAIHVPYKGGGPAINAVLSGEVSALINNMVPTVQYVKAGRLRALAVTSKTRSKVVPDVPTLDEGGLPGFDAVAWFGLFAPADTPLAIVEKLNADFAKAVRSAEVRKVLESQGGEPSGSSAREFAQIVRTDLEKWRKVLTAAPIARD